MPRERVPPGCNFKMDAALAMEAAAAAALRVEWPEAAFVYAWYLSATADEDGDPVAMWEVTQAQTSYQTAVVYINIQGAALRYGERFPQGNLPGPANVVGDRHPARVEVKDAWIFQVRNDTGKAITVRFYAECRTKERDDMETRATRSDSSSRGGAD